MPEADARLDRQVDRLVDVCDPTTGITGIICSVQTRLCSRDLGDDQTNVVAGGDADLRQDLAGVLTDPPTVDLPRLVPVRPSSTKITSRAAAADTP